MPVVFGPFLRQVAERAPVPVPTPRRGDDPDEPADDAGALVDIDAGDASGPRRFTLAVVAGAVALVVGGWLARRGDRNDG
jgi:hypothetical protein